MPNPFGLNVLAQPHIDRAALLKWVDRAKPALMLVMDDVALAQDIRARNPKGITVHRTYAPHDMRWHEVATPKEFIDAHLPTAANGVVVQCFNEPIGSGLFAASTWIEQLIAQCPPTMTLALPNMAVGNPAEDEILAGKYDRVLRAVCGTRHYLSLHEYFVTDPLKETPYFCGRFTFWQRRARQLGLPAPRIIITEHGRDIGGGARDGWRDTGWSEDQYFARLTQARELYCEDGIPVAMFCYGGGFSQRWQSFNVEGANTLLDKMATYHEATMPQPDYATHDWGALVPKATVNVTQTINRRDAPTEVPGGKPTGNKIGELTNSEVVGYYDKPFQNLEYLWYKIVYNGVVCYTAKVSGLTFAPYVEPPAPPVDPPAEERVEFKLAEVDAMIAANEQALAILRGAKLPGDGTKMLLDVPFVDQKDANAAKSPNDCLIAALLGVTRHAQKVTTGLVPDVPTVDMLVPFTPLGANPQGLLTFADGIALAKRLGYKAEYRSGMTTDKLKASISVGKPVIALVDYAVLFPGDASIPHFCVVSGFDGDEFVIQDSYLHGANVRVPATRLDAAMKTVPNNTGARQALVLVAA